MKNAIVISISAALILAAVLMSGCTNTGLPGAAPTVVSTPTPQIVYVTVPVTINPTQQSETPVSNAGAAEIISYIADWDSNGDPYVVGYVENKVGRTVRVTLTYNQYDSDKVTIATNYDSLEIDPHGTAKFEIKAPGAGAKGAKGGTYRVYISSIS
jgi:hypothetical protein